MFLFKFVSQKLITPELFINKTKTMNIYNNKNRSCIDRHCFYFGPNQLESCTEYKYLGVIFNNKGKLNNSPSFMHTYIIKISFAFVSVTKCPYLKVLNFLK
jgi:hypothetical protein